MAAGPFMRCMAQFIPGRPGSFHFAYRSAFASLLRQIARFPRVPSAGEPIGTNPNLKLVGDGFGFVVYLSTSEIKPKRRKKR